MNTDTFDAQFGALTEEEQRRTSAGEGALGMLIGAVADSVAVAWRWVIRDGGLHLDRVGTTPVL